MLIALSRYAIWLVAAAGHSATSHASPRVTGTLDGCVTDSSLVPIDGAIVSIASTNLQVRTTGSGRFRIVNMPPGEYTLVVRKIGFTQLVSDVDISAGDTMRVSYFMRPAAISLDTSRTVGVVRFNRFDDFLERREHSVGGHFITRADIVKQGPIMTTDLLRRVAGLRVVDSVGTLVAISSRGYKMVAMGLLLVPVPCMMQVMVNGHRMPPGFPMNTIPADDIFGMEIYPGPASIPPIFNGAERDMFCGLIVIWTRSGSGEG